MLLTLPQQHPDVTCHRGRGVGDLLIADGSSRIRSVTR
jgi:hypothetical protein